MREDSGFSKEQKKIWEDTKEKGRVPLYPEFGNSHNAFSECHLRTALGEGYEQDVLYMPGLYVACLHKLGINFNLHSCCNIKIEREKIVSRRRKMYHIFKAMRSMGIDCCT